MNNKTLIRIFVILTLLMIPFAGIILIAVALSSSLGFNFGNVAPKQEASIESGATTASNAAIIKKAEDFLNTHTVTFSMKTNERGKVINNIYYYDCSSFVDYVYGFKGNPNTNYIAQNYDKLGLRKLTESPSYSEPRLRGDIIIFHLQLVDGGPTYKASPGHTAGHVMLYESEDDQYFYVTEVAEEQIGVNNKRLKSKVLGPENGYVGTFRLK